MRVIKLEETKSTNTYSKEHLTLLDDKTVVQSLRQTHGRGRLNRTWVDLGAGNLFFSIVLKPGDNYKNLYSNITQYACVVLCRIFEKYGVAAKIKWPNDVLVDGKRKISGILSESVIEGGVLKGIILGIGVNLNAKQDDVNNIPDRIATGLNIEIGKPVDMDVFLSDFLGAFFEGYDKFLNIGFEYIMDEYVNRNCFLNRDINVHLLNNIKSGFAKGVNSSGELLLQTSDDKELVLNMGDIL
jgi:BirA family biotin operon repressor/biotin-[acetyl-CoA-carboxylase] ligase